MTGVTVHHAGQTAAGMPAPRGDRRIRAWITGASGFIGWRVLQELQRRGVHTVEMTRDDVANPHVFLNRVDNVADVLIDLAWDRLDDYTHASHLELQMPLHTQLHRAMVKAGVRTIVGIGTAAEYGVVQGPLCEGMPVHPVSGYAIAKDGVRAELEHLAATTGVRWRWLRLFGVWGEGQPLRTLYGQIMKLQSDPTHRVTISVPGRLADMLSVDEMASRIVSLALQQDVEGVINCGAGVGVPIRALVHDWLRASPDALARVTWGPVTDGAEPDGYWADPLRMQHALRAADAMPATSEKS